MYIKEIKKGEIVASFSLLLYPLPPQILRGMFVLEPAHCSLFRPTVSYHVAFFFCQMKPMEI
jgi:hypothetical protein